MRQIALEHPTTFVRYNRGMIALQSIVNPPRGDTEQTQCFVFLGEGGIGKSILARALARAFALLLGVGIFSVPSAKTSGTYWTRYTYGDIVLIEEMRGNRFQPDFFNRLIDRGQMDVPIYGGELPFNSKVVIITTNYHPLTWWRLPRVAREPLMRRIVLRRCYNMSPSRAFATPAVAGVANAPTLRMVTPLRALGPNDYGFPQ